MNLEDVKDAMEIVKIISYLTRNEGDSVTILFDNPDYGGPNSSILVVKNFGPQKQIFGTSTLDCLRRAKEQS